MIVRAVGVDDHSALLLVSQVAAVRVQPFFPRIQFFAQSFCREYVQSLRLITPPGLWCAGSFVTLSSADKRHQQRIAGLPEPPLACLPPLEKTESIFDHSVRSIREKTRKLDPLRSNFLILLSEEHVLFTSPFRIVNCWRKVVRPSFPALSRTSAW
jgi:hypothetical protein